MPFLMWLEQSGFATWVRESQSIWAFPSVLTVHTIGMGLLGGTVAMVNLRILGIAPLIPLRLMERFLRIMWLGFWMNALSGTTLFIARATEHASNPDFYVKLTCVALAVVSTRLLTREVFGDSVSVDTEPVRMRGKILAGTSLALWTATITAGRLMAYIGGGNT